MVDDYIKADQETASFMALKAFFEHCREVGAPIVVTCRYRNAFIREAAQVTVVMVKDSGTLTLAGCAKLLKLKFPLSFDTRTHYMKAETILAEADRGGTGLVIIGFNDIFGDYMLWVRKPEDQARIPRVGS